MRIHLFQLIVDFFSSRSRFIFPVSSISTPSHLPFCSILNLPFNNTSFPLSFLFLQVKNQGYFFFLFSPEWIFMAIILIIIITIFFHTNLSHWYLRNLKVIPTWIKSQKSLVVEDCWLPFLTENMWSGHFVIESVIRWELAYSTCNRCRLLDFFSYYYKEKTILWNAVILEKLLSFWLRTLHGVHEGKNRITCIQSLCYHHWLGYGDYLF